MKKKAKRSKPHRPKRKLCEICGKRPAEVPDRNRMGRPINRVCRPCHGDRLAADFRAIVDKFKKAKREIEKQIRRIQG